MKKHIILMFAAVLLLLCGCTHLAAEKNLPGTWRSEDGFTVTFQDSVMTVRDTQGQIIEGFPASYCVYDNTLCFIVGDTVVSAFECRVDGDNLTLIYTDSFLLETTGTAEKRVSISLVRCS